MPDWLEACGDTDVLVEVLRQQYHDHPIFADPRGKEYLKADIERCIELAGTSFRCGHTLYWAYKNPGIRTAVGASKKLGLYILKCFPQWLVTFRNQLGI